MVEFESRGLPITYNVILPCGVCVVAGELDQSILSEYEERLAMKRQEVSQLQRQRDKLLATQSKLQAMQHNMTEASSTASGLLTVRPVVQLVVCSQ